MAEVSMAGCDVGSGLDNQALFASVFPGAVDNGSNVLYIGSQEERKVLRKQVNVRLTKKALEQLQRLQKMTGLSQADVVIQSLDVYFRWRQQPIIIDQVAPAKKAAINSNRIHAKR
jgi:hypothetical protein